MLVSSYRLDKNTKKRQIKLRLPLNKDPRTEIKQ